MKVKLIKSYIGLKPDQKKTLRALGLRKLHQTIEAPDNKCIEGMVRKVSKFVEVIK
ncbi:50S ribosomal protein L30 [Desulfonatronovibrio magnus]|uniref:50S ribosomal protein L30 n=1 Tax=Desulfonatronovibrio magnus TaxID=698827 RepID=UPI0005EB2E2D|nr:50S ribosomal protein L30 [Desulfonatronovibrio magnus]